MKDTNRILVKDLENYSSVSCLPDGLKIEIDDNSFNNIVRFSNTASFSNVVIKIRSSNCNVFIGDNCNLNNVHVDIRSGDSQELVIRNNNIFWGAFISLRDNSKLYIDDSGLFSTGLKILTTDGHTIFDKFTKEVINQGHDFLCIKSHVWVGCDCILLKYASIDKDSVIAAGSVVTHNFLGKTNVIIGGNPAKLIKENINWDRDSIPEYLAKNN